MRTITTLIIVSFIAICFSLVGCADNKNIDGVKYRPYGLINESEVKVDSVHYEVAWDGVVAGVLFSELLVPPFYVFGFNLYEPTCKKRDFH